MILIFSLIKKRFLRLHLRKVFGEGHDRKQRHHRRRLQRGVLRSRYLDRGRQLKQYDDYPSISTALEADEVDAFCVDKSILAVYKTAGRSYIDAEFSPQEYGIATTKGSGFSKLCEDEVSTWLSDGTIDGLIAQYNLG